MTCRHCGLPGSATTFEIAQLVAHEIARSTATVAEESPRASIDEIGQKNTVARFHFGSDGIGGMPGIVSNRECVAGVGGKRQLSLLRLSSIGQELVEDGADMCG